MLKHMLRSIATLASDKRPISRQSTMNRVQTLRMAQPLSFRKSAIVLRSDETPRQPHDFDVATGLPLQPPGRLDPVHIAVDAELEQT